MENSNGGQQMSFRWCFTIHLGELVEEGAAWAPDYVPQFNGETMDYLVYQYERTLAGGVHVQGYVRFKSRRRMSTVKRALGRPDAHLEPARGTEQANYDYCTKVESRLQAGLEHGVLQPDAGVQGKRSDLARYCDRIQAGETVRQVARDAEFAATYVRYNQGLTAYATALQPDVPIERDVRVVVLWGATGTGKTHRVMTAFPQCLRISPNPHPWDAYEQQTTICFDEFDYTKWTIQEMNGYMDKWPQELRARYRNRYAAWTLVVICANSRPDQWWPDERNNLILDAFRRRITATYEIIDWHNPEVVL